MLPFPHRRLVELQEHPLAAHLARRQPVLGGAELWLPLEIPPAMDNHDARVLQVVGRLAPGRLLESARAELAATGRRLAAAVPQSWARVGTAAVPLEEQIVGDVQPVLLVLQAAVGLVLLVACANLASLLPSCPSGP